MEASSFSPRINLNGDGEWLLAVTSFERTNCVFNIIDENNSFSNSTLTYQTAIGGEETFNKITELSELLPQNDIELHLKKVTKRGT